METPISQGGGHSLYSIHDAQLHRNPSTTVKLGLDRCPPAPQHRHVRSGRSLSIDLLRTSHQTGQPDDHHARRHRAGADGLDNLTSRLARFLHIAPRRASFDQKSSRPQGLAGLNQHTAFPCLPRTFSFIRRARPQRSTTLRPTASEHSAGLGHTRKSSSVAPIPGNSSHPPILFEDGVSGNGARAFAAQYNRQGSGRPNVLRNGSPVDHDDESGIDIEAASKLCSDVDENSVDKSPDIVRRDFIRHLPPELSAGILARLDFATLISAESVSKAWHKAASSHHVWREVFANSHTGVFASPPHCSATQCQVSGGRGLGRPGPNQDWKKMVKVRRELEARWQQGKVEASLLKGHVDSVYCVHFDETKIITGSRDRTIRVWDIETKRMTKVLGPPTGSPGPAAREQSSLSCSSSQQTREPGTDKIIVSPVLPIHDAAATLSGSPGRTRSLDYHNASVLCLQFDKQILVSGSSDTTCIVWNINEDYRPVARLRGHSLGVLDVVFDDRYVISCSKDTTLCVWARSKILGLQSDNVDQDALVRDPSDEAFVRRLVGHKGPVNAVQIRGNLVASASGDAAVKLWNLDSGLCIREFLGHSRGLACIGFSEDARLLVSGGNDNSVRVWDARTGEQKGVFQGHKELVRTLAIECSTGRLISGSYDNAVKVWDLRSMAELTETPANAVQTLDFPRWHKSWILGVKVDYRRIITTSQDGKCLVLDFGQGLDGIEMLKGP